MAQLSNITLPNGTTYGLKGSIYTVIGTQNSSTGTWTGALTSLTNLYNGLTIAYYLPYESSGNVTLNLNLYNNTSSGAINCYFEGNTRLNTQYKAGSIILLTYYTAGSIAVNGTVISDNRWIAHASNTSEIEIGSSQPTDSNTKIWIRAAAAII